MDVSSQHSNCLIRSKIIYKTKTFMLNDIFVSRYLETDALYDPNASELFCFL